jgi:hypothetical protein
MGREITLKWAGASCNVVYGCRIKGYESVLPKS